MLRALITASAVLAAFGSTTAASAVTYNVTQAGVFHTGTVNLSGTIAGYGAFNKTEITGPIVLKGTTDAGDAFEVVTFCFDLLHNIGVGIGTFANVNYTYTALPVTNDLSNNPGGNSLGLGNALSLAQIEKMSGLANLGAAIYASGLGDKAARLGAISAAIWSTEYGLTASNFSPANGLGYYNSYIASSFTRAQGKVLIASNAAGLVGNRQGLGIGTVPEPQSWALLIVGFGLIGVSARRNRRLARVAA
jgi:hypothetical protein